MHEMIIDKLFRELHLQLSGVIRIDLHCSCSFLFDKQNPVAGNISLHEF